MFHELSRFRKYINSDNDGKIIRNRVIIVILIIIFAIIFNRFVLSQYMSDDLRVSLNQSKLLFVNGKSPYDLEIQNYIKGIAKDEGWLLNKNYEFDYPLFQLLIYLPFAVIPDYLWASAFFMTINQICIILIIHMLFRVLKWRPKVVERIIIYLLSAAAFFIQENMFSGNSSIIQLTFIVAALFFEEDRKPILSGIFLGLSFIDPISMLFAIILWLVIFISRREFSAIFWAIITVGLLSIFAVIFDGNWIIGWLKNLILNPSRFPFTTYIDGIQTKFSIQVNKLFITVPIVLVSWFVLETIRTPKETTGEAIWLLCISGLINYYVMVRPDHYAAVMFFPSIILIISVWWDKITIKGKFIFFIVLATLTIGYNLLQLFMPNSSSLQGIDVILLGVAFFFLTNLYWARPWIMRPYFMGERD